jgi:hypothetical protein
MIARACYLLGLFAAFIGGTFVPCPEAHGREYLAGAVVHEHESPDPVNRFFDLAIASDLDGEGNGGIPHIGIITTKDSRLGKWLKDADGKRVALSLRAGGEFTRDGQDGTR